MKYILLVLISLNSFAISRLPQSIENRAIKYLSKVSLISNELGVDNNLVNSMIWTESHFNNQARSYCGANGLLQIMPKTFEYLKKHYKKEYQNFLYLRFVTLSLNEKEYENIFFGLMYIKELQKRFNKDSLAIVSYNMGPSWTSRNIKIAGLNNKYLKKVKLRREILKKYYYIYQK